MMKSLHSNLTRILILIAMLFPAFASHAQQLLPGMVAPEFTLPDAGGQYQKLADWQGQWLVLYFYPKDNTPGCTTEAKSFRDAASTFGALKARVVGISLDDVNSHQAFADKHQLSFILLSDPDGNVARQYGALFNLGIMKFAKRHTFLIDPRGRIAKIYRDVDPATHAQELIGDIRVLASHFSS
jgi:peroxiredoxin Q/BCP